MRLLVVTMMFALMVACGGGADTTSTRADSARASADGQRRLVDAPCPFQQTLGASRGDALRVTGVRLIQTVEQDADALETQLAAGKDVIVRVDLLSAGAQPSPARQDLLVLDAGSGSCETLRLRGPSQVPQRVDDTTLTRSWTATIPARLVKPGLSVSVVFDDEQGRDDAEAARIARAYRVSVAPMVEEQVRIIPLTYRNLSGSVSSAADVADLLRRLHPLGRVNAVMDPAYAPPALLRNGGLPLGAGEESAATMRQTLREVDQECQRRHGSQGSARNAVKCLGIFPSNLTFRPDGDSNSAIVGLAIVGGVTLLSESLPLVDQSLVLGPNQSRHWITDQAVTLAHEFGHLLNLDHAACGSTTGNDPRLYSDGRLGQGAGHDASRGFYFPASLTDADGTSQFADLMSYCNKAWTSDRGYRASLAYRTAGDAGSSSPRLTVTQSSQGWQLTRAGIVPATLQSSDWQLDVLTSAGHELLPLACEVYSDVSGPGLTPCHVDIGDRQLLQASLVRAGTRLATWPLDLLSRLLQPVR